MSVTTRAPLTIGRYALHREIGRGGYGAVHLGTLHAAGGFRKIVAVKRLHPTLATDRAFAAEFVQEARIASRVVHANVVQTLDVVERGDERLLVLEYVHGESLRRLVAAGPVPSRIAVAIFAGVLRGLHAAHEARSEDGTPLGVVHRDVCPENILVGVDGVARLLDFGIARAAGKATMTREGVVRGKLGYMAPEQREGAPTTRRSDIFATAAALWETLTGERLFAGETPAVVEAKVANHAVRPPSELVPDLPRVFNRIALRGLARDPELRYATAEEMALALEQTSPASVTEVAAWVRERAAPFLAERDEMLAAVMRAEPRANVRRRQTWALALLVAAALGGGVAVAKGRASGTASLVPVVASEDASPRAASVLGPVASEPIVAPSAPSAPPATTRAPKTPPSHVVAATKSRDCDPPYTVDAEGRQHFKRECLE